MDRESILFLIFIACAVAFVGAAVQRTVCHASAIKAGYAQYHPTTGEWEWKK